MWFRVRKDCARTGALVWGIGCRRQEPRTESYVHVAGSLQQNTRRAGAPPPASTPCEPSRAADWGMEPPATWAPTKKVEDLWVKAAGVNWLADIRGRQRQTVENGMLPCRPMAGGAAAKSGYEPHGGHSFSARCVVFPSCSCLSFPAFLAGVRPRGQGPLAGEAHLVAGGASALGVPERADLRTPDTCALRSQRPRCRRQTWSTCDCPKPRDRTHAPARRASCADPQTH